MAKRPSAGKGDGPKRRGRKTDGGPDLFAEPVTAAGPPGEPPPGLPDDWRERLAPEFGKPYFPALQAFLTSERAEYKILPAESDVFNAFRYTPYREVRVLLLGQDPYPTPGNAHGLAFSVLPGVALPGSLRNIFKELHDDVGCKVPNNGYLVAWAEQGVMLLNAVLTVRANEPNSHQGKGWEHFTDAVIRLVSEKSDPVVFLLWGAYAQKKIALIDADRHTVIKSAHPSPLSARNGFFGSRPFSKINAVLKANALPEIDWQIPDVNR